MVIYNLIGLKYYITGPAQYPPTSSPTSSASVPTPPKKVALTASSVYSSVLKNKKSTGTDSGMDKEVFGYLEECRVLGTLDVKALEFWKARTSVYPM